MFFFWHARLTAGKMMNKSRIDSTLLGLLIGIAAFGVVSQLAGMFFVESMLKYTTGLWIGVLLAAGCAWHMWWSLDRNLTMNADNEGGARAYSIKHSILRYAVICLVFVGVCMTDFAYPLATFLGVMGLKAGAYLHPVINKILHISKN